MEPPRAVRYSGMRGILSATLGVAGVFACVMAIVLGFIWIVTLVFPGGLGGFSIFLQLGVVALVVNAIFTFREPNDD